MKKLLRKRQNNIYSKIITLCLLLFFLVSCDSIQSIFKSDNCNYYGDLNKDYELKKNEAKLEKSSNDLSLILKRIIEPQNNDLDRDIALSKVKQIFNKKWVTWKIKFLSKQILETPKDNNDQNGFFIIGTSSISYNDYLTNKLEEKNTNYIVNIYSHFINKPTDEQLKTFKLGDDLTVFGYIYDIYYYPEKENAFVILLQYSEIKI